MNISNVSTSGVNGMRNLATDLKNNMNFQENKGGDESFLAVVYESTNRQTMVSGLYTATAVSSVSLSDDYHIQVALHSLEFYIGPTDGNLSSDYSKKAIKNFQKVYGLTVDGIMNAATKSKLSAAYTMKCEASNDSNIDNIVKKFNLDITQRDTLLNIWIFLRKGMGLNQSQAAGVCGNIRAESVFSSNNAQDSKYSGVHNSDYKYSTTDSIGYGLLQWTIKSRKEGLKSMASSMGLDVSDINAQLAFFRKEMASNDFKNSWAKVKAASSYSEASDIFLEKIENPKIKNYKTRRNYAKIIYSNLKAY